MTDLPSFKSSARLQWDEQGQPVSSIFGDVYFSTIDGIGETDYVFLQHNRLLERWQTLSDYDQFVIGETGFGTGLNFLCAWNLWHKTAPKTARLHFVSVEKFPLSVTELKKSLSLWPQFEFFSEQLLGQYPTCLVEGVHRLDFGNVCLTLIINDAVDGLKELQASYHEDFSGGFSGRHIDAWFLDGFSPSKNPQMWSQDLFNLVARLSTKNTTFATFTSARVARCGLADVGFSVSKIEGYGKKREMIFGCFSPPEPEQKVLEKASEKLSVEADFSNDHFPLKTSFKQPRAKQKKLLKNTIETPWQVIGPVPEKYAGHRWQEKTVAVIGGGLAGSMTAYELSRCGFKAQVFEAQDDIAQGASGNPQGVVYARLSPESEPLSNFNLLSVQMAQQFYSPLWKQYPEVGQRCGVLQLAFNDKQQYLQQQVVERFGEQCLFESVDAEKAQQIAGIPLHKSGLYFPNCGWVHPRHLCRTLLNLESIPVHTFSQVEKIRFEDGLWNLTNTKIGSLGSFSHVVIANAKDALQLKQTQQLPLRAVRGQISFLSSSSMSQDLKTVVCSEGYLAPADTSGHHCLGATFTPKSESLKLLPDDHLANFNHLEQISPELANDLSALYCADQPGRAGVRCTTPDYLPIVGPVPITKRFDELFGQLRKNARQPIASPGSFYPGLYTSVGYGSRALSYLPLATRVLTAHMNNEPNPIGFELARSLHPARFLIRDLIRNKR